ncbi:MAG: hypothetical protein FWD32_01025 [Firmicutes bacterium]|nr:hypothetical protein [Bacillota bacterium]
MIKNEVLEKITAQGTVANLDVTFNNAKKLIEAALVRIAKRNNMFNPTDVNIYMQGSYLNGTNVFTASNVEIVVELTKTASFDPATLTPASYSLINNYFLGKFNLDYTVENLKHDLYLELNAFTDNKATLEERKTIHIAAFKDLPRRVDILPAFSFKKFVRKLDGGYKVVPGILVWDDDAQTHIMSFPKIHAENVSKKDKATNGNFVKMVRIFKTLRIYCSRAELITKKQAPGYFVECLIYNVPNSLFKGTLEEQFLKIINWLVNDNLLDNNCANEQWALIGTASEFWNILDANDFLLCMAYIWHNANEFIEINDLEAKLAMEAGKNKKQEKQEKTENVEKQNSTAQVKQETKKETAKPKKTK